VSVFARARFAVRPSGDLAAPPRGVPLERQPLSIGEVAVGTALGSLLFWSGLLVVAVASGARSNPLSPVPNPFARFRSFSDCERQARRRGVRDPGAYCGAIKRRVEG
jgi:hypothetical protein